MQPTILIIGGTGSLGQALVIEVLKQDFRTIRLLSRNEYLQWQMRQEARFQDERLRWMIGDVRDRDRLAACLHGVDYVIHAAALKHVSTGQYNPQEVIKTNILGSVNVVDIAAQAGVKKVLGISSDKAVNPSCLYGSTKQIMETLFLEANRWALPHTAFSILRSGNFFESHGNVFEVWEKQAPNGTVKLSDANMRRYFIPIEQIAKLTIQLLETMEGWEIFIPKMKEYWVQDLLFAGLKKYPDAEIEITGKTEGEKDYETLFAEGEKPVDCGDYWTIDRRG